MYQEAMELHRGKEQEYLLNKEEQEKAVLYNQEIRDLMVQLAEVMEYMDAPLRKELQPCFIAGEAISLFNRIGLNLSREEGEDSAMLAAELEGWFYQYKKLWRTVSQESELFQVTHIISWYGDWLRDRK